MITTVINNRLLTSRTIFISSIFPVVRQFYKCNRRTITFLLTDYRRKHNEHFIKFLNAVLQVSKWRCRRPKIGVMTVKGNLFLNILKRQTFNHWKRYIQHAFFSTAFAKCLWSTCDFFFYILKSVFEESLYQGLLQKYRVKSWFRNNFRTPSKDFYGRW